MKALIIVGIVLFVVVINLVAAGVGLVAEETWMHDEPEEPGFWLWDLGKFLWNHMRFMFELVTFQVPEIPVWLNAIVIFPMMAGLLYILVKAVIPG